MSLVTVLQFDEQVRTTFRLRSRRFVLLILVSEWSMKGLWLAIRLGLAIILQETLNRHTARTLKLKLSITLWSTFNSLRICGWIRSADSLVYMERSGRETSHASFQLGWPPSKLLIYHRYKAA